MADEVEGDADYEEYQRHRTVASQVETLYLEIKSIANKKPSERISPLLAKKINHVLKAVKDQVTEDEFLDAIESLPVSGNDMNRYDEALITLSELRSVLDRQWGSEEYISFRRAYGSKYVIELGKKVKDDDQSFSS